MFKLKQVGTTYIHEHGFKCKYALKIYGFGRGIG